MMENKEFETLLVEAGLRRVDASTIIPKVNCTMIEAIKKLIALLEEKSDECVLEVICNCLEFLFRNYEDSASLTDFFSEWKRIFESLYELAWKSSNKNMSTLRVTQLLTTYSNSYSNWEDISLIFFNVIKNCNSAREPVFVIIKTFLDVLRMKRPKVQRNFLVHNMDLLEELRNLLMVIGDFDLQIDMLEVLLIFVLPYRGDITRDWFLQFGEDVNELYLNTSFRVLEHGARPFLNKFNNSLGENQVVFSIKCHSCDVGGNELDPPCGESIWVDVNLQTERLTITCADFESEASGSIVLSHSFDSITSINVDIQNDELMISLQSNQLEHMGLSKNMETEYVVITANTIENGVEHVEKFFFALYSGCEGKESHPSLQTIAASLYTGTMDNLSPIVNESKSPKFFVSKVTFFPIHKPDPETPLIRQTTPPKAIQESHVSSTRSKRKLQRLVKTTFLELEEKGTTFAIEAVDHLSQLNEYKQNESFGKGDQIEDSDDENFLDVMNTTQDMIEELSILNGTPRSLVGEKYAVELEPSLGPSQSENVENLEIAAKRTGAEIYTLPTDIYGKILNKMEGNELPDTTCNMKSAKENDRIKSPSHADTCSLIQCKTPHLLHPFSSRECTPSLNLSFKDNSVEYSCMKQVAKPKEKISLLPSRLLPIKATFDGVDINTLLKSQNVKDKPFCKLKNPSQLEQNLLKEKRNNFKKDGNINFQESGKSKIVSLNNKAKVKNIKIVHENIHSGPIDSHQTSMTHVNTMMPKRMKDKRKLETEMQNFRKKMKTETTKNEEKPKWKKDILSFYEAGHMFGLYKSL